MYFLPALDKLDGVRFLFIVQVIEKIHMKSQFYVFINVS